MESKEVEETIKTIQKMFLHTMQIWGEKWSLNYMYVNCLPGIGLR